MIARWSKPHQREGRIKGFHVLVVGLSLLLTITAWQFSKYQGERQNKLLFEASRDQALGLIADRMVKYEDALWAGVAAIKSHGTDISYQSWQTFAETLRIGERYPGINGIGVIHFQTAETLDDYLARQHQDRPYFRIFPEHKQDVFMPITFIVPEADNTAAIGLDVAHEVNRRTAALASRDTGNAQITGPITLVQDADRTSGFLFFAPFYSSSPPDSIADRQTKFLGAVYAPFVVHRLMEGLLAQDLRNIRFDITDGDELIYDEHDTQDPMFDPAPMYSEQISLELYGRIWTLDVRTNLGFRQDNTLSKPTLILLAGLFIEMLIVALLFQMSRAHTRAVAYADKVTVDLIEKSTALAATNIDLSAKNDELEQFSYVASHDLKTPLRGIGGLTEMVQEDLENYLASASANPDVGKNLARIHDRVRRMERLTRGILEYSQTGSDNVADEPVELTEVIEAMTLDFGLDKDQLRLFGNVGVVDIDTFHFRRVLENLVGNAVKYHDRVNELRVSVSVQVVGKQFQVSVIDNGPGIAPEFHERIFCVFQTLQINDAPESTGIGLSIVKKAVERHGNKISLKSSLSKGANFTFDWPGSAQINPSRNIVRSA